MPTCHQLDRISDEFTTDQGGLHPFGAHGHAVRDRDGVVLNWRPAGGTNTGLDVLGQVARIERTGITSIQECATPTSGRARSSLVKPTALSMARAGARSGPSVM